MRARTPIRAAAGIALAAGVSAPLMRKRLKLPAPAVLAAAASAPVALCVLFPRSRARDAGTVALQMWAYLAGYEMPNDDPDALRARVHVDYPVRLDRALGLGTLPTARLQHAFSTPGRFRTSEKVLVWSHWVWFMVPHGAMAYILLRHPERFERSAVRMYATFDLGLIPYWRLPTAPPWYAAARHGLDEGDATWEPASGGLSRTGDGEEAGRPPAPLPEIRRMMVEYGEEFWKSGWAPLYDLLAGNPLAAMPSLHFATSVMAARLLGEASPVAGALGWAYAGTLGLALVYLGEHYVVDLAAGFALTEAVRRTAPRLDGPAGALSRLVQRLEARAA